MQDVLRDRLKVDDFTQIKKFISEVCLNSDFHYMMSNGSSIFVKANSNFGVNYL